jgi:WD40 repeat protein
MEQQHNWCLATVLNARGSLMVWVQDDAKLQAWDVAKSRLRPLNSPLMRQGWHGVAFLPDDESVIYVARNGVAEMWNVANDRRVGSLGAKGAFNAPHIALSSDGVWFAGLTQPDAVSVWHRPSGKHAFSLRAEAGNVWALAWDRAGRQLAVGQTDGSLAVWRLPLIQQKLAESGLPWEIDAASLAADRR